MQSIKITLESIFGRWIENSFDPSTMAYKKQLSGRIPCGMKFEIESIWLPGREATVEINVNMLQKFKYEATTYVDNRTLNISSIICDENDLVEISTNNFHTQIYGTLHIPDNQYLTSLVPLIVGGQ